MIEAGAAVAERARARLRPRSTAVVAVANAVADGHITQLRYTTTANGRKVPVTIDYTVTNPAPTVAAPV